MRNKFLLLLISIFAIPFVFATSPTEFNVSVNTYTTQLPYNGSVTINLTSNNSFDNISVIYYNVTKIYNSTSNETLNVSWVSGPENISFDNQTEYTLTLDYSIPDETDSSNYTNIVKFVHYDNSTDIITFNFEVYYNITINWSCNYNGSATLINAYSNLTYDIDLNTTSLPYNETYQFALCSEPNEDYYFMADRWLTTPENLTFGSNDTVKEFNVTLEIPEINLTTSMASYEKSFLIYNNDFSRVVDYDIIIRNESYVEGNESTINDTWVLDLDNMTASEFIELMNNWSQLYEESIPEYVVEYINNTEYVNVPVSMELFKKWIEEYNPEKMNQLNEQLETWKKRYGEEESDNEAMKKAYNDQKKLTDTYAVDKENLRKALEEEKKKYKKKMKSIFLLSAGCGGFLLFAFLVIRRLNYLSDFQW